MNTAICDAPTSELADALGPLMETWLKRQQGWTDVEYLFGMRVFRVLGNTHWCLSEVLDNWMAARSMDYSDEFHEDCPWQDL